MKKVLFALLLPLACAAQSITITTPAASATISGYSYNLTCSFTGISTAARVNWIVDGESLGWATVTEPHTCPSFNWDTYNVGNGSGHVVDATVYDAAGTSLASASEISFNVENWLPQQTCTGGATNPTPDTSCGGISVTAAPAASMNLATAGAAPTIAATAVTLKPSGGSAPVTVGSVDMKNTNGTGLTSLASNGRSIASTSNYVVVFVHWFTPSAATISTLSDSDGNNLLTGGTCTSVATSSPDSGEICVLKATATHVSGYVVTATFAGTAGLGIYVYEVSGATASSAVDVTTASGISAGGATSIQLVSPQLPMTVANELIFYCAGWSNYTGGATAGAGYTLDDASPGSNRGDACEHAPEQSAWIGQEAFVVSVTGSNNTVAKDFNLFVDGLSLGTSGVTPGLTTYEAAGGYASAAGSNTSTSKNFWIDTTRFYNSTTHRVAIVVNNTNATNCSICINGSWGTMGTWEREVSFSNPSTALVELTTNARDQKSVCPGAIPGSCTTPVATITGTKHFADGSTSAGSITCVSNNTAVATVSGCTITPVALGSASITATDASGLTRNSWFYVVAANNYPNVGIDGTIQTSYVANNTNILRSGFQTGGALINYANNGWARSGYTAAQFQADWKTGGYNAVEVGLGNPPGVGGWPFSSEAAYDAFAQSKITTICSALVTGMTPYFVADSFIGSNGLYYGTRAFNIGPPAYVVPSFEYLYSQWLALCGAHPTRGNTIADEVTSIYSYGTQPCGASDNGCTIGSGDVSQVACTAAGNCVASCPAGCKALQSQFFIITGSGTGLDYPTTGTGTGPAVPTGTLGSTGTTGCTATGTNVCLTWSNPGVGTITYTASSNNCGAGGTSSCANLKIEPNIANATFNAAFATCNGVGGAAPCTDWVHSNAFINYYTQAHAGNAKAIISYAPSGTANTPLGEQFWCGAQADTCDYYSSGITQYIPTRGSLISFISDSSAQMGGGFRADYGVFALKPTTVENPSGVTSNYAFTGYPVNLTSCTGDTCLTAAAHNLANVQRGFSRMYITGSTGGADGAYMIRATPDGTHIQVVQATPTATGAGTVGTLTFDDTNTYTVQLDDSDFLIQSCPNNALLAERGHNFTSSTKPGSTWYYDAASGGVCGAGTGSYNFVWQVPNLSSTGGTAWIIPDNYMIRGRTWEGNGESGYRGTLAVSTYGIILGGHGSRTYLIGAGNSGDPMGFDPTQATQAYGFGTDGERRIFGGQTQINLQNVQAAIHPEWPLTSQARPGFMCMSYGNLLTQRLVKYAFQPWLPSPDLGMWFEDAVRQDGSGNRVWMIQNFEDAPASVTVDLTPYKITGQAIIKYVASCDNGIAVSTLASGTTTDTTSGPGGFFVAYVFDNSAASVLIQPTLTVPLQSGAADVLFEWSYSPLLFQVPDFAPQVVRLTGGTGTLPIDSNIGPVYGRIRQVNGVSVLSTGAVQQF